MLFGGLDNIRDCIAFPKTQKAADLMTEAPGPVDVKQLRELGIQLRAPSRSGVDDFAAAVRQWCSR